MTEHETPIEGWQRFTAVNPFMEVIDRFWDETIPFPRDALTGWSIDIPRGPLTARFCLDFGEKRVSGYLERTISGWQVVNYSLIGENWLISSDGTVVLPSQEKPL